jgi:aconitase A
VFTDTLELDLSTVEPSLAGPKRPQDRVTAPRRNSPRRSGDRRRPQGQAAAFGRRSRFVDEGATGVDVPEEARCR